MYHNCNSWVIVCGVHGTHLWCPVRHCTAVMSWISMSLNLIKDKVRMTKCLPLWRFKSNKDMSTTPIPKLAMQTSLPSIWSPFSGSLSFCRKFKGFRHSHTLASSVGILPNSIVPSCFASVSSDALCKCFCHQFRVVHHANAFANPSIRNASTLVIFLLLPQFSPQFLPWLQSLWLPEPSQTIT